MTIREFLAQIIKDVGLFWVKLQRQQAIKTGQLINDRLEDLVSDFQNSYYKALEYKCRDDETQGLDNEFTLELQKVFVPLKIAANNASNTRQDIIPVSQNKSLVDLTIWDCLAARDLGGRGIYKRLVILGRPGSGKTTLLRHLTLIYSIKKEQEINKKAPKLIPVLFYLRDIRDLIISNKSSLKTLIQQYIENLKINNKNLIPPSNWVNNKLQKNEFIIMLDGLDEVANKTQRQQVRTWIDSQMQDYPDTVFILTSRPNGYKEVKSRIAVNQLEVQPFNREQITNFLQRWYLQTEIKSRAGQFDDGVKQVAEEKAINLIERIINNRPLVAMAVNPLLLKMIATVHRRGNVLPGKRVELYKDICQILLEKRQRAKNIFHGLTASQKQSVLQVLALSLMQKQTREFTLAEAKNWISQQLTNLPNLNNTRDFIKHIQDDCALLVEKEIGEYEFAHLSFQEYLAAIEISESHQENILIQNIDQTWWSETIRLYGAQSKDATNIVSTIINMPSPSVNAFLVIAYYEEEGWRIDKQVRQQLIDKLDAGLESDDAEIFKLAAEVQLARQLNNLTRVNEILEQDNSYITCAEYQLFINDSQHTSPKKWLNNRFIFGDAKKAVNGLNKRDINRFCTWLTGKYLNSQLSKLETFYKPIEENGKIRLSRVKLPSRYKKLSDFLYRKKWREADDETLHIILKAVRRDEQRYLNIEDIEKFPCEDFYIINLLWVAYSQGYFGFSVQQEIYQSLGVTLQYDDERKLVDFGDRVGWRERGSWLGPRDLQFNFSTPTRGSLPLPVNRRYTKNNRLSWESSVISLHNQTIISFLSRAEICNL
ncbi:GUN4 domain-containing protein [Mastigocoleus testarum]|uniref:GUN4 domain-containing protein n=1 Tax=Mastigocoleus testarum TaxID=996925 RepID=UPI00128EAAA8|nr:GUN4 domain-containing protein [Mastigocoleus testarum]